MRRGLPFLFVLLMAAPLSAVSSREALYRHAYETETSERDPEAALAMYRVLVDSAPSDAVTVSAQFRAGQCLEKLGRGPEALEAYRQVLAHPELASPLIVRRSREGSFLLEPKVAASAPVPMARQYPRRWWLMIEPGVSWPVLNADLDDSPRPSALLQGALYYHVSTWLSAGLESGYSFGHGLDASHRSSAQPLQSVKRKIVQATPSVLIGPWIRTGWLPLRPYAALGAGYYNVNVQSRFLFNGLPAVASDSHHYTGFNLGGGLLARWNESFAAGPDLRYHQVLASGADFHYLAFTLRLAFFF